MNANLSYPENNRWLVLQPKFQLYREMLAQGDCFFSCFFFLIFPRRNRRLQRVLITENFLCNEILFSAQVFVAISLILGDGVYNLIKIIYVTIKEMTTKRQSLPTVTEVTGRLIIKI